MTRALSDGVVDLQCRATACASTGLAANPDKVAGAQDVLRKGLNKVMDGTMKGDAVRKSSLGLVMGKKEKGRRSERRRGIDTDRHSGPLAVYMVGGVATTTLCWRFGELTMKANPARIKSAERSRESHSPS